ncbi:N-myristoyl transferase [Mollisia scopiformis]|uniref:Glycylpeptide N-tetradecanoyltransferase n=1 Tax=Mollisia scopiformis TaxID=149040 RepID=A0A194XUJ9_MOLSC|nr:N-myristoyl transferase [Mollisia scopiformis]KUJ23888.1 N-myristoyl transferase [Mollisia scopiformis]
MADESKIDDPATRQEAAAEVIKEAKEAPPTAQVDDEDEDEAEDTVATGSPASGAAAKKKKSKRKRIKNALTGGSSGSSEASGSSQSDISKLMNGLSKDQLTELVKMNPGLAQQLGVGTGGDLTMTKEATAAMKKMSLEEIMSGLASSGKNVKDMGQYKFWATQPVPKFGESSEKIVEGPFKIIEPEQVPKDPGPLVDGFEWVTMDLLQDGELEEVFQLLSGHYVEDDEAMFRFNYSKSFLKWALLSPGWTKDWHVGVRASASRKLVAFISAIPVALRVRKKVLKASEVNFLCIHKKLRAKRLAPVLIKEITRRCYRLGTWQAIYTGGVVLPKPVSTCRYFHRSIDWQKLYEVGFSPLPPNSKPQYQVRKYALPDHTATKNLRAMEEKDIDGVLELLKSYLARFEMAPIFTRDEVEHWLLYKKDSTDEQVIWSYVVEDPATNKITDFFSFYCLESSVINNSAHKLVRAAYLFYYATTACPSLTPSSTRTDLSKRLNELVNDALILAKKYKFDVFNALTLLDNNLFLEQQKFGAGDGQLHYYLYNYNANPIAGGVNARNQIDESGSGIGVVML